MSITPKQKTVHIIGAGVAGLSSAIHLSMTGCKISLYEAAPHAGGRCRSYFDDKLAVTIDNGNHLVLGANVHLLEMLSVIGANNKMHLCNRGCYPFVNIASGEKWQFDRLMTAVKQLPGGTLHNLWSMLRAGIAVKGKTVEQKLQGNLYDVFWNPLSVSILNTPSNIGSAEAFSHVLVSIMRQGKIGLLPYVPNVNWSDALIDPMVEFLYKNNAEITFGNRIKDLEINNNKVVLLSASQGDVVVEEGDQVIVAVPPFVAQKMLPHMEFPDVFHPIVNGHFLLEEDMDVSGLEDFIGVVNGQTHWVFKKQTEKGVVLSTTTSAADELALLPDVKIAALLWKEVKQVLELPASMGYAQYRIIKEKRATFSCSIAMNKRRPDVKTGVENLFLAGDYTKTGLPSTIEGAVLSGKKAADVIVKGRV